MDSTRGKFRGKCVDGKWVEGNYLHLNDGLECELDIIVDARGQYKRIDPETLGECTGYTDTLGRLVFEGDIVKTNVGTYIIEYLAERASFIGDNISGITFKYLSEIKGEIIGNVHEKQTSL